MNMHVQRITMKTLLLFLAFNSVKTQDFLNAFGGLDKLSKMAKGVLDSGTELTKGALNTGTEMAKGVLDSGTELTKGALNTGTKMAKGVLDSGTELVKGVINTGTEQSSESFQHALDGLDKLSKLAKGVIDTETNQSNRNKGLGCLQCVDVKIDNPLIRAYQDLYRTPECADAQTADTSRKITIEPCIDAPKDGHANRCGRLDGNMKVSATSLLLGKVEEQVYLHMRGCFSFPQATADGCSTDKFVIDEQQGITKRILDVIRREGLVSELEIGKIDGRLCADGGGVAVSGTAVVALWSTLMANFLMLKS